MNFNVCKTSFKMETLNSYAYTSGWPAWTSRMLSLLPCTKLGEQLKDINFWKFELERNINEVIADIIAETDLLLEQNKRLENALRTTEEPLNIATDNLNCRQHRQNILSRMMWNFIY